MHTATHHTTGAPHRPWIFAHRGSCVLAPENTARACDLAVTLGADVLEIDVRLSRDAQVIVTHDATLERTTNGHGPVRAHSWPALKKLDAGYHFVDPRGCPARGQGLQLLHLQDLLERCAGSLPPGRAAPVGINIDIKDNAPEAVEAVAAVVEPWLDRLWLNAASFHPTVIKQLRPRLPELSTSACLPEVAALYFSRYLPGVQAARAAAQAPYNWLQIPPRWRGLPLAGHRFIDHAERHGLKVAYWTINDAASMQHLLERGAHGLVSDRVDLLASIVRAHVNERATVAEPLPGGADQADTTDC